MSTDPILVLGAGIAGLALAQGLRKHSIPFRVFERDESFHSRSQGYRVRISDEGIQTLEDHLPREQFERLVRACGKGVKASNIPEAVHHATVSGSEEPLFRPGGGQPGGGPPGGGGGPPPKGEEMRILSADRSAVREVLRQGIEDFIEHGKDFDRYEENAGGVMVYFKDGTSAHGRALVGADGAWSKVRRQKVPDYRLADSEGRLVFGKTELSEEFVSQFEPLPLKGLKLIRSERQTCLLETMRFEPGLPEAPSDYIYWVLFMRKGQHMPDAELLRLQGQETLRLAQRLTSDWLPNYSCMFDPKYANASIFRIVTSKPNDIPTGLEKASKITLVGDAAHPMPPTAALGATSGLRDAGELVKQLVADNNTSLPAAAMRVYEGEVRQYAAVALQKSLVGGKAVFGMKPFDELPLMDG